MMTLWPEGVVRPVCRMRLAEEDPIEIIALTLGSV
jgi:hypothetical protein